MSKEEAVLRYPTAMSVFKQWLADGVITDDDLVKIEAIIAEKYGLSSNSIYREKYSQYKRERVINASRLDDLLK